MTDLKSPFPYPGGKAKVADRVWARLGNVDNYCEPFAGSLAVLMRRPPDHFAGGYRVETVNDASHYLVNFWRAVKHAPDEVAEHADWPVTECDLHARHKWLVRSKEAADWRAKMVAEPEHYDAKIAGYWCWGLCCWIGSGWCANGVDWAQPQRLSAGGQGVNGESAKATHMTTAVGGLSTQRPELSVPRGVTARHGRPQLADAFDIGRGVNSNGAAHMDLPDLGHELGLGLLSFQGACDARREWLTAWMRRLSDRLRLVRTCYGHWSRICDSDSTLTRLGVTGVFLDPPYPTHSTSGKKSRADGLYANDKGQDLNKLRDEVLAWCRKWGGNPQVRVAVCGYEGDGYEPLVGEGWGEEAWEASGGYSNQNRKHQGKGANAKRERIWYSPHCVAPSAGLFDDVDV